MGNSQAPPKYEHAAADAKKTSALSYAEMLKARLSL